ncbi:FKBP-type peptidyl-prolyl cis-trans isomerase [Breznakiellaceae bacterium SP9]
MVIKKLHTGLLYCLLMLLLGACGKAQAVDLSSSFPDALDKDTSYALGVLMASNFANSGLHFDYEALAHGLRDNFEGLPLRMTFEQALALFQPVLAAAQERAIADLRAREADFLVQNSKKEGIIVTLSGLQYEVLRQGTGNIPKANDTVTVNYESSFMDGTIFDSTIQRGQPAQFELNGRLPIAGLTESLLLMPVGASYRFYIPSSLAFGPEGAGNGDIPPYSVLIFTVDLLEISSAP